MEIAALEVAQAQVVRTVTVITPKAAGDAGIPGVTVTLTGTNDAATVSSDSKALTETNAVLSTSGTLTISDVDSSATFVAQTGTAGTYGTFNEQRPGGAAIH